MPAPWIPEAPPSGTWNARRGGGLLRRITEDGVLRYTEQGVLRIIERGGHGPPWGRDDLPDTVWSLE